MVQLTHELITLMKDCEKDLENELINRVCKSRDGDSIGLTPHVIIIDVLDHDLAYDKDLPQLQFRSKRHIECPIIYTIDDTPIQTLDQVAELLIKQKKKSTNTLVCGYNMKYKRGCGTVLQL